MVLCGASIIGFTVSVLLDVVTRTIGHPWLWLQQVTTGFFAYGVFVGMAWDYATGPFGTGLGLDLMFVGAVLLVVGGALGFRERGGTSAGDNTPA